MALKNGINKFNEDKQKLKNAAGSQAISPLTEKTLNGNNNPDSLNGNNNPDSTKMAGTAAAQQGVANQQAKDPTAVQNGALAQQQQQQAQQRGLQAEAQSVADFRSEGVEKAQEAAAQKSEKWASDMVREVGLRYGAIRFSRTACEYSSSRRDGRRWRSRSTIRSQH